MASDVTTTAATATVAAGPARPAALSRHRGARREVPGPEPDPGPHGDPAARRLAAARGARRAVARRAPAAVRDRGRDLVLPALPHVAAEGRAARGLPRPHVLAARLRRPHRARRRSATATTSRSRSSRSPASAAATSRRPRPSTSGRCRSARSTRRSPPRARETGARPRRCAARTSAARTTRTPTTASTTASSAARSTGDLRPEEIVATLKDSELRGMGGAGFPTGQKWEIVAGQEPQPHYTICNADESEPGTFKDRQILAEQPHLVLEGMMLGMLVTGSEEGWIFIRHEYGPEEHVLEAEIERAARGGPARRRRPRHRAAPADRDLHLARRLHPRRGVGAAGVHGGPPRRAAQQAAVPRPLRAVGQADADELRRDVRRRADHPRARRGLVEGAGHQRRDRPEVLRRVRPRRAARRLLRARGVDGARPHRAGGRRHRRPRGRRDPARRRLVELPRPRRPRRPAGLEAAAGGGLDARLGRADRHGRGDEPARRRHERAALLPQRVLRQVRAVPRRLDEGAHDPQRPRRAGQGRRRTCRRRSRSSRRRCG